MLECPHCYRIFRTSPEKLGARCPKCRMPLFERPAKRRQGEKDLGDCGKHPEAAAVGKCVRCARLICATCRTRWHDEPTCPECVERSLTAGEATFPETQRQQRQAWTSVVLAAIGWFTALLVIWPISFVHGDGTGFPATGWWVTFGAMFFFLSFIPALLALGQGTAALRLRGPQKAVATCGLVASGLQLGLLLGVIVLNLWHN